MFSCTYFDLNIFYLYRVSLRLGNFLFFILRILILTIVHELADRGIGIWRYLNEVKTEFLRLGERFGERHDAQIFSFGSDNAKLGSFDLVIDTCAQIV